MGIIYKILFITLCLGLCFVIQMGFIFLMLALMPSVVAYYTDATPRRVSYKIVCACNMAATMPQAAPMFRAAFHAQRFEVTSLLASPTAWMIAYVGAAIGWLLIYVCRFLARFFITMSNEHRAATLTRIQENLVEEWGKEITEPPY